MTSRMTQGVVFEDHTGVVMAYVTDLDGDAIAQADVASIVYTITDETTEAAVSGHAAATLVTATVIFNTLQTPTSWTLEGGFNFRHVIGVSAFPAGDRTYTYVATITLTDGTKCVVPFLLDCKKLYAS